LVVVGPWISPDRSKPFPSHNALLTTLLQAPYECSALTSYEITIGGLSSPTRYTQIVCVYDATSSTWLWHRFGGVQQPDLTQGTATL
jgi:hypothetical protein